MKTYFLFYRLGKLRLPIWVVTATLVVLMLTTAGLMIKSHWVLGSVLCVASIFLLGFRLLAQKTVQLRPLRFYATPETLQRLADEKIQK